MRNIVAMTRKGTLRMSQLSLVSCQGGIVRDLGDTENTCGMGLFSVKFKKIKMCVFITDVFRQFKLQGRRKDFMYICNNVPYFLLIHCWCLDSSQVLLSVYLKWMLNLPLHNSWYIKGNWQYYWYLQACTVWKDGIMMSHFSLNHPFSSASVG